MEPATPENNAGVKGQEQVVRLKNILKNKIEIREKIALRSSHEIKESIRYAKRIQEAVLQDPAKLADFFPDCFIYNRPKDIVSGDFYWFTNADDVTIVAVADCTGHGVPGGFMCMLGSLLLRFIVMERGIRRPSKILTHLHAEIHTLRQYEEISDLPDGMDISVCVVHHKEKLIRFSGANHSLFRITSNELKEIKGDKFGIGGKVLGMERIFTEHQAWCERDEVFFMLSDGVKDQFGGPQNKKLGRRNIQSLLRELASQPCRVQQQAIAKHMEEWQGSNDQTDDMLILGFRV